VYRFFSCHYFLKRYTNNYLHGVCIVLGIISNLYMTEGKQEDVCRVYANSMPFYLRVLNTCELLYLSGQNLSRWWQMPPATPGFPDHPSKTLWRPHWSSWIICPSPGQSWWLGMAYRSTLAHRNKIVLTWTTLTQKVWTQVKVKEVLTFFVLWSCVSWTWFWTITLLSSQALLSVLSWVWGWGSFIYMYMYTYIMYPLQYMKINV
jgi:hypothetical protein